MLNQRLIVTLLGARGKGLDERTSRAIELIRIGVNAIVPKGRLPSELSPSIAERELQSSPELDRAFVNVESWRTVAGFAEFQSYIRIVPKLRVMVALDYHPPMAHLPLDTSPIST